MGKFNFNLIDKVISVLELLTISEDDLFSAKDIITPFFVRISQMIINKKHSLS